MVCLSDDVGAGDMLALPSGYSGSGVVFGNQPLAGVINLNNRGFGRAAGQYNATSANVVDTNITFPLVKYNHWGRTTTFYIQNASNTENTITATFKMNGMPFTTSFPNVKPYARVILQPGDVVTPTSLTIGSLVITGTQNLAGISLEHPTDEPMINSLQASRAFIPDDYGFTVQCPLLRHGWSWNGARTTSGLQVQNVGDNTTTITVKYTIVAGNGVLTSTTHTHSNVAPGESANFLQENHFYTHTLASAVITSSPGEELVAVVNDRADGTNPKRFLTYACFNDDNVTTTISLPLVKEHFYGNTSGIQVQNTGTISTHLVLTYTTGPIPGNIGNLTYVISTTSPIGPGSSKTFWNITAGGTANITITPVPPATNTNPLMTSNNGVIVKSVSWNGYAAQPIVAIAVESTENGADPQDSKAYEGVNID